MSWAGRESKPKKGSTASGVDQDAFIKTGSLKEGNQHHSLSAASSPTAHSKAPTVRLTVAQYQSASAEALRTEVKLVQDAVCACQAAYTKALADVNRSSAKIQQLEGQVESLQQEDAALSVKVPLPINRLSRVRQWLSEKVAALDAEQAALEGKRMALLKAESKLRSQETEASLLDEAAGSLNTAAALAAAAATRAAAEKHDREAAAARRQLKQAAARRQQEQQQAAAQQAAAKQRTRVAQECQAEARERLAASQVAIAAGATAVAHAAAGKHSKHWEPLLQLKAKVDEVRDSVAKKAEKTRQLRKQKKKQEQREFEALQEQGLNPYEVYRVRDAEATAAHAAAQLAAVQRQRKADIAAALAAEDQAHRKVLAKQEFDRKVEEDYQRQMGVTAQQQRTEAYMLSHTLTKQALLNSTSRVPVYPSEAVLVKPVGFGLGRASPEAVRKVAAKHGKDAAHLQDCLLLPSKYRSGSSSPAGKQSRGAVSEGGRVGGFDETDAAAGVPDTAADTMLAEGAMDSSGQSGDEADSEEARDVDGPPSASSSMAAAGPDAGVGNHTHSRQPHKQKQLQLAKLSKFEAGRLELAKQKHKTQIAQPKAAFGRVFAGDAFIADPTAVVFKDFVPGHTYKATVHLINRSFTGSSIRLVEVPTEVMHVLELDMPRPGCLAPGAAATLRITFKPQADEPLSASIPLLADTGPLILPFKALVRQALPNIDPSPTVSLDGRAGGVMLGASGHTVVTITNAGALPMLYTIKAVGPLAATTEYDEPPGPPAPADASEADLAAPQEKAWASASLAVAGIRVQGIKGRVPGYGSCTFRVEFTPKVPGAVEVPVVVSFTAPDSRGLSIAPVQLTLHATGKELPVSTLTPVVDFRCVMYGQSYAASLLLANAGKSAMKVLVAARPELSDWISFTPDFGFIQASDTLTVSIALKPTPNMTHKLAKYLVPQQQDCFEIPVQVNVPGQPLPIPVKVLLQATTSDLYLSPKTLDFGRVPLTEAAGVYITVTNPSALPQSFSFGAKLPLGLKLSPNTGYGRVLPKETIRLLATFQPPIPGVQYFDMCCRTLSGRVFKLEGKCDGLQPDVSLSHNVIMFPATAYEDSSSASLVIRNSSSDCSQLFEFGVPQGSFLKVTPRVGMLKPQSTLRLQIDFAPPALTTSPLSAQAAAAMAGAPAPAGTQGGSPAVGSAAVGSGPAAGSNNTTKQGQAQPPQQQDLQPPPGPVLHEQQQTQQDPEPATSSSGHFQEWLLPCFIKQQLCAAVTTIAGSSNLTPGLLHGHVPTSSCTGSSSTSTNATAADNSSSSVSSSGSADYVLHVSVATCAIRPELQLVSRQLQRPAGKNYWVLDFGALPVGERTTRELLLHNTGPDIASLIAAPLDPLVGAFGIVNALRPLQPQGGEARVLLAFSPPDCCEYQETLTLRSNKSRLRFCLKGQGIASTLAVSPALATAAAGGLAFGDVLLSDPVCKEMKLQVTNTCPFTITYSTRFIGAPAPQHGDGKGPAAVAAGAAGAGGQPAAAAAAKQSGPQAVTPGALTAAAGPAAGTSAVKPPGAAVTAAPSQQQQQQSLNSAAVEAATAQHPGLPSGCFWCKPSGGVLEAGQTQEVTVVFAPLGGAGASKQGSRGPYGPLSPYVADRLQILVPHQQQDVVVPLHGSAWPDGVFVSGASYRSSSSRAHCTGALQAAGTANGAAVNAAAEAPAYTVPQDPFAAIMVAAARAAATAPAAASSASGSQSSKAKQAGSAAAAAVAAAQLQEKQPTQPPGAVQPKDLPSVLAAVGYCDLTQGFIDLPGPVSPGQVSTVTVEFGAVKSSAGGAAGELVVEDLPAEAKEAGWSVDAVKVSTPVGERRPLTIRYTAPAAAKLAGTAVAALGQLQVPVQQVLKLNVIMKGGCQPVPGAGAPVVGIAADGSRRLSLVCSCVLDPVQVEGSQAVLSSGRVASAAATVAPPVTKK